MYFFLCYNVSQREFVAADRRHDMRPAKLSSEFLSPSQHADHARANAIWHLLVRFLRSGGLNFELLNWKSAYWLAITSALRKVRVKTLDPVWVRQSDRRGGKNTVWRLSFWLTVHKWRCCCCCCCWRWWWRYPLMLSRCLPKRLWFEHFLCQLCSWLATCCVYYWMASRAVPVRGVMNAV